MFFDHEDIAAEYRMHFANFAVTLDNPTDYRKASQLDVTICGILQRIAERRGASL